MNRKRIVIIGVTALLSFGLVLWGMLVPTEDIMGVIADPENTAIVVSDQVDADGSVTIDLVRAPRDAFVVVHQSEGGMPGKALGYTRVEKGESRDVVVELDPDVPLTPELVAAVHVDAGVRGEFEFDMEYFDHSPDKPFFADGKEVADSFRAAEFGVPVDMGKASIEVGDQPLGDTVTISKVVSPADAFVVVHRATADGMPGERIGYAAVEGGESTGVSVEITEELSGRTTLIAAIHADKGVSGKLEFDMEAPVASPDQPYFADGMEVAAMFDVGEFGVEAEKGSIEATDQVGATDSIRVDRVVAPADGWIVVHLDKGGAPGARVGIERVEAGTSREIDVPIDSDKLTEKLFIALHADRGETEIFEFDMMNKFDSPDQPFFVDGEEVAVAIKVREFGVPVAMGQAMVEAVSQPVVNATVRVARVISPTGAWVVAHLDKNGMPGKRVGLVYVGAGESRDITIQLDASVTLTDRIFVALHADRGEKGIFEFNMMDRVNSPDQPFFVEGMEVAAVLQLVK